MWHNTMLTDVVNCYVLRMRPDGLLHGGSGA